MPKEEVRQHFEAIAGEYDRWKEKSSYYYRLLTEIYREFIPSGSSVLEVGCGTGSLLSSLEPRRGVGLDFSPRMVEIASARHPSLTFVVADAENFELGETFDFIIVPDVIEHLSEPVAMFRSVRKCCRAGSFVIVTSVNPLWAPVLHLAERLGMKMPEGEHRWLSRKTLDDLARKAGFILKFACGRILCPKKVPLMAGFLNRAVARREVMRPLCLTQVLVLTPCGVDEKIPVEGIAESSADPTKSENARLHRCRELIGRK